ncbi:MAG: patatin-like phospholipase family protein [Bacteroidia bacterium]|jgi:patatin-like phospholipase/acyl hydrolase|nr:patatin-like phospholipase family protein [Bacteroidia bacterium]
MKKIITIDGGGIRGIVPGVVLRTLEQKIQHKLQNPKARLAEYVDFMAGTSTGGILVSLLLCNDGSGKPKYSAADAVDLYIKNGSKIFDVSLKKKINSLAGLSDERFDAKVLEELLHQYFGDLKLSQLLKPCLITSYDIKSRKAHFFTQHDAKKKGDAHDFLIRDVCRATSAAPTYFETALVKSRLGVSYALIDGGIFVNNPSMCAYAEVRNAEHGEEHDKITAKRMWLLSLGTGDENISYEYDKAKNWGMASWLSPLIDMMMSGSSEVTHYYLLKMFDAADVSNQYKRIAPTKMYNADTDMANASDENIQALVELGLLTVQQHDEDLEKIADFLISDGNDALAY